MKYKDLILSFKDLIYYWKVNKLIKRNRINQEFIENFFNHLKEVKKGSRDQLASLPFRNFLAKVFKKYRGYKVNVEYIYAKTVYNKWLAKYPDTVNNKLNLKVGDWCYFISDEYPIKGKLFNSYYVNVRSKHLIDSVFQIGEISIRDSIEDSYVLPVKNIYNSMGASLGQIRKATEEEIEFQQEINIEEVLNKNIKTINYE